MKKTSKLFVISEMSISRALKHMDEAGEKILLVVDNSNRLIGTVTDGDIRRWILKGRSHKNKIQEIMNKKPVTLNEDYSLEKAKDIMLSKKLQCIPVLDTKGVVISAVWWTDLFKTKFKIHKKINIPVVIMAGGEGTRLHPFTKVLPKPLLTIGDRTILELIIERFVEYGCNRFTLSVNYKSNIIKAYFNDFDHSYALNYVEEQKPLGTAGSLYLLRNKIKSTFYVSNCDILIEADYADILNYHRKNGNLITLVASMKHYTIPYGVCEVMDGGFLKKIIEKPEYDYLVSTGLYLLEPEVLKDIPSNTHYNITDLIKSYMQKNEKIGVYPVSEKSWVDIGQWEELKGTLKKFGVE
jgi:dTDP-glucose pyrophosphorylase